MPQIIEQGDIFGRIGKSMGEGVSEQYDRSTLSKGLKKISANPDLSESDRYAELLALPGGAEHASYLIPALGRAGKTSALKKLGDENSIAEPVNQQVSSSLPLASSLSKEKVNPISRGEEGKKETSLLAHPEALTRANSKILQPATVQDEEALARKLINTGQAIDSEEALRMANEQLKKNREAQQEMLSNLTKNISAKTALNLQNGGLGDYTHLTGKMQKTFNDEAKIRVLEGADPAEVEDQISDIQNDLGRVTTKIQQTGSLSNLTTDRKEKVSELKKQKQEFDKYGFGETFDEIATAALGITPMQLHSELNPVHNDKFQKLVKANKQSSWSGGIFGETAPMKEELVNRLVETITPQDDILSMAADLRDHHMDVASFMERARQKKGLTPEQDRQLQQKASNSFLGDILFRIF